MEGSAPRSAPVPVRSSSASSSSSAAAVIASRGRGRLTTLGTVAFWITMLSIFVGLLVQGLALTSAKAPPPSSDRGRPLLQITAIGAKGGVSTLECWEIQTPFATSNTPGTQGVAALSLGEIGKSQYIVLPPGFDGGLHTAPANQWVYFTTGLAHVTLPTKRSEAWITGGRDGLIFAADVDAVSVEGHFTEYPGRRETIGLTIPTEDGTVPPHRIVHQGPCAGQKRAPRGYRYGRNPRRLPGRPRWNRSQYKN